MCVCVLGVCVVCGVCMCAGCVVCVCVLYVCGVCGVVCLCVCVWCVVCSEKPLGHRPLLCGTVCGLLAVSALTGALQGDSGSALRRCGVARFVQRLPARRLFSQPFLLAFSSPCLTSLFGHNGKFSISALKIYSSRMPSPKPKSFGLPRGDKTKKTYLLF